MFKKARLYNRLQIFKDLSEEELNCKDSTKKLPSSSHIILRSSTTNTENLNCSFSVDELTKSAELISNSLYVETSHFSSLKLIYDYFNSFGILKSFNYEIQRFINDIKIIK